MNQALKSHDILKDFGVKSKGFAAGMSESGKSTIGRAVQALYPRKIIIDPLDEYKSRKFYGLNSFIKEIEKVRLNDQFEIIYSFPLGQEDTLKQFDLLCRIAFYTTNLHLSIEESHEFSSPSTIGYWYSLLNTGGRHNNVSLFNSSQRFATVHNNVTSQAHHKFVGQLDNGRDFKAAAEYFPDNEVRALTRYNFIHKYNNELTKFNTEILRP